MLHGLTHRRVLGSLSEPTVISWVGVGDCPVASCRTVSMVLVRVAVAVGLLGHVITEGSMGWLVPALLSLAENQLVVVLIHLSNIMTQQVPIIDRL